MAKTSAKNANIMVDNSATTPVDISKDVDSFTIEQDAGKVEVTGFSDGGKNYIPGMPVYGITMDVFYDASVAWLVLAGILNSITSVTVKVTPEVGGPFTSGEYMLDALPLAGKPSGAITVGTVHFSPMGSVAPTWAS